MKPLIVVAEGTVHDISVEETHLGDRGTVRLVRLETPDHVRHETRDADAIVVTTHELSAAHIDALGPRVRVIGRAGTGLDAIDLGAAARRGLFIYHTPDCCTAEVATHAVAMILAVHRRLVEGDRLARTDFSNWRAIGAIAPLDELTAGVVGSGRIGRAVMARLAPFVGRILAYDPYVKEVPLGVEAVVGLEELLRRSNILTLHSPLTVETRGLIGAKELALLPADAVLVNVARGGIVDEAALGGALASGHLGGAALDVLASEPPAPGSHALKSSRLLLTPHIAWYSTGSERRLRTRVIDGVVACLSGDPPQTGRIALDPRHGQD